ncbi:MAG: dihydrolipoyl dehydrogenase [Verrucomicrobiota bacterium]|nr:dihydrolipoyl dehydrogenase [Verrucomicrobiota bacterium]
MTYDLAVIGSGPGGYVAAIRAAQLGLKVACIEKGKLGGTCLNVGCIPSKALLHSSELYWKLSAEYAAHGIHCENSTFDFRQMMSRKNLIISSFTKGIESLFGKNKVDWIQGVAKLQTPNTLTIGNKTLEAKHILLATGSEPIALPFLPFDEKRILSSTGALALEKVPKKLLLIGAGIIGVELGSVYRRLGSEVVCIEFLGQICPAFDNSLSKALQKSLTAQGIAFHLSHKVTAASGLTLTATGPAGETQFTGDAILVAIGRRPYTQNLGLENVGLTTDSKGFIPIDSTFRTAQPNIFAIGDLVGGPMLAHKASEEGVAVAELLAGHRPTVDYASIPNVAYTFPEVAAVGFTEEELKAKNIPYKAGQFPFKANSRARCTGEDEGFVKLLAAPSSQKLLGAHIFGPHASELIAEAALAIRLRATVAQIISTPHAHPTLSEALKEAALAVFDKSIHY